MGILEARCSRCGEDFNPLDEHDLIHIAKANGEGCGGQGSLYGEWLQRAPTQINKPDWTVNDLYLELDNLLKSDKGRQIGRLPVRFIGPRMTGPMDMHALRIHHDHARIT